VHSQLPELGLVPGPEQSAGLIRRSAASKLGNWQRFGLPVTTQSKPQRCSRLHQSSGESFLARCCLSKPLRLSGLLELR